MPWKPAKPCRAPGCAALVQGAAYCPDHTHLSPAARYDRERRPASAALALSARIRSSGQWQQVRAIHRAIAPLCADPFGDHAKALGRSWDDATRMAEKHCEYVARSRARGKAFRGPDMIKFESALGGVALNEQSHHIRPLATHPELAFDLGNLAPLCTACHGKVERMERAGRSTVGLFQGATDRQNLPGVGGGSKVEDPTQPTDAATSRKTHGVSVPPVSPAAGAPISALRPAVNT